MKKELSIIGIIPQYPKHSQNNIYAKIKMPPVGILSVMSQIHHHPCCKEVYAIDENNYSGPQDNLGRPDHSFLQARQPVQLAFFYGGMSNSIPRMFSVARQYKDFGAITIAGGSHVDALPQEALSSGIDIVVHGEGEETIIELLAVLVNNGDVTLNFAGLAAVSGISFLYENGDYVFTGRRQPIENLNELADTDLTLVKYLKKRWSAIPINRGRGCNWNCEFCVVNRQYGRYKSASIEKALRQVIKYNDLGYKDFFFTDDNFSQNPEEAIALCRAIGDYKRKFQKKISIIVQVRTEAAENDELIDAMHWAGVSTLAIGYESPINEELRAMRKGVTVEKLIARSKKLANYFYLHGMFIFGYPANKDTQKSTFVTIKQRAEYFKEFFKRSGIDTIQLLNAVPLPGSELRARLESEGRLLPLSTVGWDKYDGLFLCYDPRPDGLDAFDLHNMPKMLMKKKYLGGFISRKLNYGNWLNWVYLATIGFPIQFVVFYSRRFLRHLLEKQKMRKAQRNEVPMHTLFTVPLANTWQDIKRKWRNLFIKTYAGVTAKRWLKEYRSSEYINTLRQL
ncbi:radical sam domain protein [hydrocarbon metagenome]|uniref:Radical sam domain protein n=1 Tax=hydrocarbon metagenome TaxID=938273 RepID=A0A0W8FR52_9ZZZZ